MGWRLPPGQAIRGCAEVVVRYTQKDICKMFDVTHDTLSLRRRMTSPLLGFHGGLTLIIQRRFDGFHSDVRWRLALSYMTQVPLGYGCSDKRTVDKGVCPRTRTSVPRVARVLDGCPQTRALVRGPVPHERERYGFLDKSDRARACLSADPYHSLTSRPVVRASGQIERG